MCIPALTPGRDDPAQIRQAFPHHAHRRNVGSPDWRRRSGCRREEAGFLFALLVLADCRDLQASGPTRSRSRLGRAWSQSIPQRPDSRLCEFLAAEYHRRKRHDDAIALVGAAFTGRPDLEQYRNLKNHADRAGKWSPWRERALLQIRETIAAAKRACYWNRWSLAGRADHSQLVRVFLWEKKVEAAWNEATSGGCSNDLWLDSPPNASRIIRKTQSKSTSARVEHTVARTSNEAYRDAIGLLRKVNSPVGPTEARARIRRAFAGGPCSFQNETELHQIDRPSEMVMRTLSEASSHDASRDNR